MLKRCGKIVVMKKYPRLCIRLNETLRVQIEEASHAQNISKAEVIRRLVSSHFNETISSLNK
jgi:hypothetical protein